jgi:hypothetical protein
VLIFRDAIGVPILNCPAEMGTIAKRKLLTGNFCSYFSKMTLGCWAIASITMKQNTEVKIVLNTIKF